MATSLVSIGGSYPFQTAQKWTMTIAWVARVSAIVSEVTDGEEGVKSGTGR